MCVCEFTLATFNSGNKRAVMNHSEIFLDAITSCHPISRGSVRLGYSGSSSIPISHVDAYGYQGNIDQRLLHFSKQQVDEGVATEGDSIAHCNLTNSHESIF